MTPINAFADGSTDQRRRSCRHARQPSRGDQHLELFATDTLSLGKTWHVTLSGRYNRTSVDNADRLRSGGGPGSLNGQYVFAA